MSPQSSNDAAATASESVTPVSRRAPLPLAARRGGILLHPVFWLTLVFAGLMIAVPVHGNNVALREDLILVAVAVILASNLNLMIGYTGYVNFGHIVFYGLGGYVGLYLATVRHWNLILAALTAGVSVSLLALIFGAGILRLRGAYFALATIGVLVAVNSFVANFDPFGRSEGMYVSFDAYAPLGGPMRALWITYYLVIGVMALSMILSLAIKKSKFGLGLFAIREDEDAAVVLGINARVFKAIIYSVSAFLPAVAGTLMFYKNGMIDPSIAFEYMLSLEGIVMLMLGGQGTVVGAALGGGLYERLRSYLLTSSRLSNFHLVIAGGMLLLVVLFAPGGLIGWLYRLVPRARKVIE
jgi:branched-chain amino acid transport system permease protein